MENQRKSIPPAGKPSFHEGLILSLKLGFQAPRPSATYDSFISSRLWAPKIAIIAVSAMTEVVFNGSKNALAPLNTTRYTKKWRSSDLQKHWKLMIFNGKSMIFNGKLMIFHGKTIEKTAKTEGLDPQTYGYALLHCAKLFSTMQYARLF